MRTPLRALLLIVWLSADARAQEPTQSAEGQVIVLAGKIRENGTRHPIVGATVSLTGPKNLSLMTFSDEDGRYRFDGLAPGKYQITVLAASYVIQTPRPLDLTAEKTEFETNIFMTPDVSGGLILEVEADRDKRSVSTQKMRKEEILNVPGTLGDPLRVVQLMPGVTILNEVFADLIVQGGGPDENRIWLDRTPMAFPYHLLNSSSVLSGEFVEGQTLHAAGFGVQYGNATGGVLEVTSSDGKEAGIAGHGTPVMVWAREAEALEYGRVEGSFQAGWSHVGAFLGAGRYLFPPPTIPEVKFAEQGGPTFQFTPIGWDYQGKRTAEMGRFGSLRLVGYGSFDEEKQNVEFSGNVPRLGEEVTIAFDFFQEKQFHTQGLLWDLPLGRVTSTLSLYRMEAIEDFKIGFPLLNLEDFVDRRESNRIVGAWEEFELRAGEHQTFYLGAQVDHTLQRVSGVAPVFLAEEGTQFRTPEEGRPPGVGSGGSDEDEEEEGEDEIEGLSSLSFEPFRVAESFNTYSVYLEDKIFLFDRLTIAPGARYERTTLIRKSPTVLHRDVLMPRAYVTYKLFPKTTLRSGWGIYRRYPEVDQATDQGQVDEEGNVTRQFGNPFLLPERAEHYVVGVEQKLTEALRIETDVFHKRLTRLITGEPEKNDGFGFAEGVQVLLRHDLTRRFFGWVSYAYTQSKRRGSRGDFIRTSWDQPHVLSVVSSVKPTPNWIVGATFRFTSGSPFTPIFNDEKRDPDLDEDIEAEALALEPNSGRLIHFHRLDFRVERIIRLRYAQVSLFLDAFNVYNRKNEVFRIPSFEDPSKFVPLTTAGTLVYGGTTVRF